MLCIVFLKKMSQNCVICDPQNGIHFCLQLSKLKEKKNSENYFQAIAVTDKLTCK